MNLKSVLANFLLTAIKIAVKAHPVLTTDPEIADLIAKTEAVLVAIAAAPPTPG
jgi:hypothetical protein